MTQRTKTVGVETVLMTPAGLSPAEPAIGVTMSSYYQWRHTAVQSVNSPLLSHPREAPSLNKEQAWAIASWFKEIMRRQAYKQKSANKKHLYDAFPDKRFAIKKPLICIKRAYGNNGSNLFSIELIKLR